MSPIIHKLEDTAAAAGSDALQDALSVYGFAKVSGNDAGLGDIVGSMKKYFKKNRRS